MKLRALPLCLGLLLSQFLAAGCIVSIGSGCGFVHGLDGSGVEATESRTVAAFQKIDMRGSADVDVTVGPATSVSVRGDDNLLQYVTTEVENGTLTVGMKSGHYNFHKALKITVTTPELSALGISGSSDARVSGLAGGTFRASIAGSGDIRARGSVERVDASIAGSGDVDLYELEAKQAVVDIAGSGNAKVCARESLDAHIAGSGDIRFRGDPKLTKSVAGSGSISRE